MNQNLPPDLDRESLNQLLKEELVEIIIEQSKVIRELQKIIYELQQEIKRLKVSRDLDSFNSSKPPSRDILKKSENKKAPLEEEPNHPKRKPGGQPGHQGKTRKGFGRIDRCEILRPMDCVYCGQKAFVSVAVKVEKHTVAQLVERLIEVVEYQRYTCVCECCGNLQTAFCPQDIIPAQDLGTSLQAFLGWANNYAHMPYEKQKEMLWELGQIKIGLGTLVSTNERIKKVIEPSIIELSNWVNSQWWYFLEHPEVPPDNNQAERSLRLAVTKRKVSGGSRSMERFQHTAKLLTVVQTCRRQGRSVIDFFAQALLANSNNYLSRPSLLPEY